MDPSHSPSAQVEAGSVVGLWRYPVKSMMGEELNAAEVTDRGLVGDRQFADFAELVARVRALARRSTPALPPTLEAGDLTLDPSRRVAFRGRPRRLAPGSRQGRGLHNGRP
jgi:hypothetical protein